MKKLLTLIACVSVASFASAKPQDDNQQFKKKGGGGNAQVQQGVATQPIGGTKYRQPGTGGKKFQNFQQSNSVGANANMGTSLNTAKSKKFRTQNSLNTNTNATMNLNSSKSNKFKATGQTGGSFNSSASNTTFNKTQVNKMNVNKNFKFQKKQFNLQTNNKQYVINKYKTVNFNQNYKIAGANKWHGAKYSVFVNYHPQWHDSWWWNWHHGNHLVFIYGGWYYWDNSYWYPAWGYAPDSVYYVDAPIYSSSPAEDPAQTVANVQSALQEQGYYQGEIDGVLGPQTRAALAEYQSAQGLEPTGLVDEPTLETLGMA